MKKAQTEIAGTIIVVILIILGILFTLRFILAEEPAQYKHRFTQTAILSNTINTFLRTTSIDCNEMSMAELLQNCSYGTENYICSSGTVSSCSYVESAAKEIFSETLDKWNFDYEFRSYAGEDENDLLFPAIGQQCYQNKRSRVFFVPTKLDVISVKLSICESSN